MFGDNCTVCAPDPCTCTCDTPEEDPQPCLPGPSNSECEVWLPMSCVYWMGDPIAGTPIKKGTKLTEVVFYLVNRIAELQDEVDNL